MSEKTISRLEEPEDAVEENATRPRGIRLLLIRGGVLAAALAVFSLAGEAAVRLVAPQELNGRWAELGRRGLRINKADWQAVHSACGRSVTYRINQQHLRGGPIQDARRRVLVLGDSFTFGWLLEEEDTYVHRLSQYAAKEFGEGEFAFLNGGRGGWGTSDYLAFLEEYGEELRPDVVLVFLNFDDMHRSAKSALYELPSGDPARGLIAKSQPISRLTWLADRFPMYDWLIGHSHLATLLRNAINKLQAARAPAGLSQGPPDRSAPDARAETSEEAAAPYETALGQALFLRMKAWCEKHECQLLVTTTGYAGYYFDGEKGAAPDRTFLRDAEDFFRRHGVPFHDITPELKQAVGGRWEEYLIEGDGHANAAGAKLIADRVWPWLRLQLQEGRP